MHSKVLRYKKQKPPAHQKGKVYHEDSWAHVARSDASVSRNGAVNVGVQGAGCTAALS